MSHRVFLTFGQDSTACASCHAILSLVQKIDTPFKICLHFKKGRSDVDFRQRMITVKESKSGEGREIAMNDVVTQILQSLPRMIHNSYVFYGGTPARDSRTASSTPNGLSICGKPGLIPFDGMICAILLPADW